MNVKSAFSIIVFVLVCYNINASIPGNKFDSVSFIPAKPLRVYNTIRLVNEKPIIDGVLNDSCWNTGEWAGDFIQWVPNEGGKASQPTKLKILYDDKNIYVAIKAYDSEPQKILRKAGRRDELTGDMVGIDFDSYHDHRTGFEFNVTAAGQKIDLILTNPSNVDLNWNAVWYVKTKIEDSCWTAEYEIPLSQLRYSKDFEQVWGMHCWRWIDRLQEESDWEPQSSKGPGILYLFGELHGIKGLPKSQHIEIMPYALGKLNTYKKDSENPFATNGKDWMGNAGIDTKIGLSSNFTANITLNPDFGQVESDPSSMNLTAFETFYVEKRPFFLEGKNIFNFDFDNVNLFYSRRIGHVPGYTPELDENEYMKFPDNTTILSAVKLSGKTAKGLSIGVLQSITANEFAKIDSAGSKSNLKVDLLTNYAIVRVQQDYKQGNTIVGGILTSTNRFINDPHLNFMNRDAYTGGLDLLHQWHDKEFFIDAKLVGSNIKGHTEAISDLQKSSARYYQRPDVNYVYLDSTRTQLTGNGGMFRIGKGSKGLWRYSTDLNWRSPGLDLNDIGFMQTADIIKQRFLVSYFINHPVSIFRTYSLAFNQINTWDYGMRYLSAGAIFGLYMEFKNNWAVNTNFSYVSKELDTHILRGGDAMYVPKFWANDFYIRTDYSKRIFFDLNTRITASDFHNSRYYSIQPGFSVMPVNALKISISINSTHNMDQLQYVDTKNVDGENRYLLGKIDQHSLGITFRIDYNITPELSIQYYGSPFASVGKYSEFKKVTKPKDGSYNNRYELIDPVLNGDDYEVSENNNSQIDYTFSNPDFDFSQFRSNLVIRWEYRAGSQIYLVWSHDRTNYVSPGNNSVYDEMINLTDVFPNNIFLIKMNYWFSL